MFEDGAALLTDAELVSSKSRSGTVINIAVVGR
jgi:hypothetical protein